MNRRILEIVNNHTKLREQSLNLLPSENRISVDAKQLMSSDMGRRYYFKSPYQTDSGISYSYSGTEFVEEIVIEGENLLNEMFSGTYSSIYPLSGHQANLAVLLAFTKPDDKIIVFNPKYGGYPGLDKDKLPKYLNLDTYYIPVVEGATELIDYNKTTELIERTKPKLIIYSSAHTLFPIDISRLSKDAHRNDALFIYDGSHPLGLIVGGEFQKPLLEGADVLIGGTQKSFPGPQGGIIVSNKYGKELEEVNHFVIVDNPHFHRIAALTMALTEMKAFGSNYAKQVVKNAKSLAKNLFNYGMPIKYSKEGFTESHMFKIEIDSDFGKFVKELEAFDIMVDSAGRIGVGEITRLGMKEGDMKTVASFINKIWTDNGNTKLKSDINSFVKSFDKMAFVFE